ncbi:hypothetical protein SALBM311S_01133 [Streptomyces alboniger]
MRETRPSGPRRSLRRLVAVAFPALALTVAGFTAVGAAVNPATVRARAESDGDESSQTPSRPARACLTHGYCLRLTWGIALDGQPVTRVAAVEPRSQEHDIHPPRHAD